MPNADLNNPQSLNLYSYVLNNPVTATDPDGHGEVLNFFGGIRCISIPQGGGTPQTPPGPGH